MYVFVLNSWVRAQCLFSVNVSSSEGTVLTERHFYNLHLNVCKAQILISWRRMIDWGLSREFREHLYSGHASGFSYSIFFFPEGG